MTKIKSDKAPHSTADKDKMDENAHSSIEAGENDSPNPMDINTAISL